MKIIFYLGWMKPGTKLQRNFKSEALYSAFHDYANRLSKLGALEVRGGYPFEQKSCSVVWICDPKGKPQGISSESLSHKLKMLLDQSTKELLIVLGAANGFTIEEKKLMKPDFVWSFGEMTLPHELAAVVAGEQIYRAFTILNNHPYHRA